MDHVYVYIRIYTYTYTIHIHMCTYTIQTKPMCGWRKIFQHIDQIRECLLWPEEISTTLANTFKVGGLPSDKWVDWLKIITSLPIDQIRDPTLMRECLFWWDYLINLMCLQIGESILYFHEVHKEYKSRDWIHITSWQSTWAVAWPCFQSVLQRAMHGREPCLN